MAQWQSWAAHLPNDQAWQQWAYAPFCPLDTPSPAPSPDYRLDFLPAMQRRRLSSMARQVFSCAWDVATQGRANMPLVFASRHGEASNNFHLLQTLAADAPISPTAFCLSVHNAIAAQWSIVRHETAESVALSAEDDGLEQAFIEAALLLGAGHEEVLVVVAEARAPAAYAPWIHDVPHDYVAAFRLRAGDDWCLGLHSGTDGGDAPPLWPNPLNLVRHLLLGTKSWRHHNDSRCWQWTRKVVS